MQIMRTAHRFKAIQCLCTNCALQGIVQLIKKCTCHAIHKILLSEEEKTAQDIWLRHLGCTLYAGHLSCSSHLQLQRLFISFILQQPYFLYIVASKTGIPHKTSNHSQLKFLSRLLGGESKFVMQLVNVTNTCGMNEHTQQQWHLIILIDFPASMLCPCSFIPQVSVTLTTSRVIS